jgi:hypothetical protein
VQLPANAISTERSLVLSIAGPAVPSLDLVDMPGIVGGGSEMTQAESLVKAYIKAHGDQSIYLLVMRGGERPANDRALGILQEANLLHKTIGIFTCCDDLGDKGKKELKKLIMGEGVDGVKIEPYGWVATANPDPDDAEDDDDDDDDDYGEASSHPPRMASASGPPANELERLRRRANREARLFRDLKLNSLVKSGHATSSALVRKLNAMYLDHLSSTWIPNTIFKLHRALEAVDFDDAMLGKPNPPETRDEEYILADAVFKLLDSGREETFRQLVVTLDAPLKAIHDMRPSTAKVRADRFGSERQTPLAQIAAELRVVEGECHRAVDALVEFLMRRIEQQITAKAPQPRFPSGPALDTIKSPPQQIWRFNGLVQAFMRTLPNALNGVRAQLRAEFGVLANPYDGNVASAWLNAPLLTASNLIFDVSWDSQRVADSVRGHVCAAACGFLDDSLRKLMPDVVRAVALWNETCAVKRGELHARRLELLRAEQRLLQMVEADRVAAMRMEVAARDAKYEQTLRQTHR